MTHRATVHVPIRHLPPGQLRPDGAYRDQGPIFLIIFAHKAPCRHVQVAVRPL
jgi:hypothetical protein